MRARHGHTIAEALCALALGGVLAAAAAVVLSGTRGAHARLDARFASERVSREALAVAAALIRASDSAVVRGDTAVELSLRIGRGVVCGRDSATIWIAPARVASGRALTTWTQVAELGDAIQVLAADTVTGERRWVTDTIEAASDRVPSAPCDADQGWLPSGDGVARMRVLTLRGSHPEIAPGDPVRVSRAGRIGLYVDGRGEWMLGWRRCVAAVCGVVQPVAGPLRTPAAGGFRVAAEPDGTMSVSVHAAGTAPPQTTAVARLDAIR